MANKLLKPLIWFVFVLIFLKGIVWSLFVPLWHFPDEQAHFGHVAYLAEGGGLEQGRKPDLTEEIYISEEILGTKRDIHGNNRFTYHPEYRIEYGQTQTGIEEERIKTLPLSTRKNFVIRESAYYPHFFYQVSALIYRLFYSANLFVRVFSLRLFWLSAHLLMIWLVFQSAKLIFPKQPLTVLTITLLTGLHPMLSFVASGVSSDNLLNLLFTAVIYFSLRLISQTNWLDFLGLGASLSLGLITKPQFLIALPVIAPLLLLVIINHPKRNFCLLFLAGIVFLFFGFILAPSHFKQLLGLLFRGELPYLQLASSSKPLLPDYNLLSHLLWTIKHTIREVLPWYWGVFNWLGVVLPRWVNRVLMRLLFISGLGLLIKFYSLIKKKKLSLEVKQLSFVVWAALVYFAGLLIWDWSFFRNNGFSFGVQGRYYFPVIISHMILLVVGFETIIQSLVRLVIKLCRRKLSVNFLAVADYLLIFWFVILNLIALYVVAGSYYDLNSFKTFIIQASQYKPWFAKGMFLSSFLLLYLILSIFFLLKLSYFIRKSEK
jgi:hypothetical protein